MDKSTICSKDESREVYSFLRAAGRETLGSFQRFSKPPYDLSFQEARVLLCLRPYTEGTSSIGALAKEVQRSLPWTSRVVDALTKRGLVGCIRDERNRTLVHVKLTAKGTKMADCLSANLEEPITAALSEVQPQQRQVIGQFLRRFTAQLNTLSKIVPREG